jgi:hypothetical protein
MNERALKYFLLLFACGGTLLGRAATLTTTSLDNGGGRATSATYVNDSNIGMLGGISSAGTGSLRSGYAGQLTDVTGLAVTGTPATVSENATAQLSGAAVLDDTSLIALAGSNITWSTPAWPLAAINSNGVATAAAVHSNTLATVTGYYYGVAGTAQLNVLDVLPDNFGTYASDGLPDSWQVQYYGIGNPLAVPTAIAANGRDNLYDYTAALVPTNPASRFIITSITGLASRQVSFDPSSPERLYTLEYRTDLTEGAWSNVTGSVLLPGGSGWLADTNAAAGQRFYRLNVVVP